LSVSATNSALHRAREAIGTPRNGGVDPPPALLREYIRSWEEHDVEALVALLRDDVALAMPPHATWFRGARAVEFLRSARFARFWSQGVRVSVTRANAQVALLFWVRAPEGLRRHSLQLVEVVDGRVAQILQFIGDVYLHGFEQFPERDLSIET
ncbi:MAG TPA: nuclear transport factor 2 family protein, partial [Kofleriaceae bacterium]